MALNEQELMYVYHGLMKAYPSDLHIARPLIQMMQARGKEKAARELAMNMSRRMLSLGYSGNALSFLSICEMLNHPDTDEIDSMKTMAKLTAGDTHVSDEARTVFELIDPLSDAEAQNFLKQGALLRIDEGQNIVSQGEISRNFYLILDGSMRVHMETKAGQHIELITMQKGNFFGEFACVFQLPRTATVTAADNAVVLKFSVRAVAQLMESSPLAGESLMKIVQRRMVESMSYGHPALGELASGDRDWLAEESELLEFSAGDVIGKKGDFGADFFYIIAFGKAAARREVEGGQVLHSELSINAMYGDATALLRFPADTVLHAYERCLICKVPVEIFTSFSNAYGGFEYWLDKHTLARNKKLQLQMKI
ncbi:MAG: cyclic nucleotide-binding domain-containing protein [Ghiorsea sp.]